tara:strand:+ start:454 stop:600 length:147 start_codon:yes stop_codon:yes gene_type:complete
MLPQLVLKAFYNKINLWEFAIGVFLDTEECSEVNNLNQFEIIIINIKA